MNLAGLPATTDKDLEVIEGDFGDARPIAGDEAVFSIDTAPGFVDARVDADFGDAIGKRGEKMREPLGIIGVSGVHRKVIGHAEAAGNEATLHRAVDQLAQQTFAANGNILAATDTKRLKVGG